MTGVAARTEDDAFAIERMLDDGAPANPNVTGRMRTSRRSPLQLRDEPSADDRAAHRRAARRVFRLYCFACGRSTDVSSAPARPGRCVHCGGTMLIEVAPD